MQTTPAQRKPHKVLAIELFALNPAITVKEVASKVGVSDICVAKWRQDPMFIDKIYEYNNFKKLQECYINFFNLAYKGIKGNIIQIIQKINPDIISF